MWRNAINSSGDTRGRLEAGSRPWRYLAAVALASVGFLLKITVAAPIHLAYLFAYPAVFAAAGYGGLGPGLLATVLSGLLATYYLLEPVGRFAIGSAADAAGLGVFLGMGTLVSLGAELYRRKSAAHLVLQDSEQELRKARDTAQRRAEELAAVLGAVPAAILIARDRDAKRIDTNAFAEKLLRLEPGANASKSAPPGEGGPAYKVVQKGVELRPNELPVQLAAATGQDVRDVELDILGDGWSARHIFGSATPLRDESGVPYGAVGAFIDITAAHRAEERMRALVSNGADVVMVVDENARLSFVSENVTSNLGRSVPELQGAAAQDFIHPEDQAVFLNALAKVLEEPGATGHAAGRILHGNGSWRIVEATGRNLLHDPAVKGVVVNVRDVTEQRGLEAQLREAQKMESIGRLAGGVAHDFNNLLTVIMAGVAELKEMTGTGLPASEDLLEDLSDAAERARDLTRQLLLFARRQVASPVPLNLNDVVVDGVKLLRRTLGEDVKVVVSLQDGLRLTHCDPGQASQVLMNLAVNARDAMPRGGVLTIETRNVDVSATDVARDPALQPGSWVQLLVRDTGHGISPEVREHLFEPFFTTKAPGRGTGLGLATVHGIVGQFKGFIAVRSEPGEGATFEVYLPRADLAVATSGKPAERQAPRGAETVLVVDDEGKLREAVARVLRKAGYEVLVVGDGTQALALGPGVVERVQLLLTDVVMPGPSGLDVVDGLRRLRPHLPVLYMSGFTDSALVDGEHLDARTRFIAKPFTPEEVLTAVREMLAATREGRSPSSSAPRHDEG